MGFTKAPVNDTHNTIRFSVAGTPFVVSDPSVAQVPLTLNYINCFPIHQPMWGSDPKLVVYKREAFEKTAAASGTINTSGTCGRSSVMAPDVATYPNFFFTKHSNYYMFNYTTKTVSSVTTSTVAALAQTAMGTLAVDSTNAKRICYLDANDELKTFLQDGTSVTTTTTGRSLDGRKGLVFLNGYLFAVDSTGYKIHNSTVAGVLTTWASTDFIAAEQYADPVQWLDKHRNHLVAFGTMSTEFFADGGVEVGSPLVRQEAYSRQIGIVNSGYAGKVTAHIDDDIYFIGVRENSVRGFFRIRNFQIEEIKNAWLSQVLNRTTTDPQSDPVYGLETMIIGTKQHIVFNLRNGSTDFCYTPDEDAFWLLPYEAGFPDPSLRLGTQFYSVQLGIPMFLQITSVVDSTLYYTYPDYDYTTSVTAYIYTPPVDMGINFMKHFARVDVIGDIGGDNVVTLGYNGSPNYESAYTDCTYTRTPGTDGYQYGISFYNLGYWRRGSFRIKIAGTDKALVEGLDIEYNVGAL